MGFDDFVALQDRVERLLPFGVEPLAARGNEGGDGAPDRFRFDDDRMPADDAVTLQTGDTVGDGGTGDLCGRCSSADT